MLLYCRWRLLDPGEQFRHVTTLLPEKLNVVEYVSKDLLYLGINGSVN